MCRWVSWLTVVAILGAGSLADAQREPVRGGTRGRWYRAPGAIPVPVPVPGYGYPGYSSTPAEGAQRGFAEVVRARGEAAESTSRAALNLAEAQSKYIENSLQWTQTYWERKRLGEAQLAADYAKKRETRDKWLAQRQSGAPDRLSPGQLDPASGQITWPLVLQTDVFALERAKLEELFQVRAQTSITPELVEQITAAAGKMQDQLNAQIRSLAPNDYIAGRRFLESLAYEARFPAT